jgi:hypothetical protein
MAWVSVLDKDFDRRLYFRRAAFAPVTNKVTTAPGVSRYDATYTDVDIALTSGNPTHPDTFRRNRHAW